MTGFNTSGVGGSRPVDPVSGGPWKQVGRGRVLIVDDESKSCAALEGILREEGYEVATARDAFLGLDLAGKTQPNVVLTALRMPGLDGLGLMRRIRSVSPASRIVVTTAVDSVAAVVEAMKCGADDVLAKPVEANALRRALRTAMDRASRLAETARSTGASPAGAAADVGVVGNHPSMQAVLRRAGQVASTRATVLLTGETGTGKGLLAETIHRMSGRSEGPFVELTCAALSETLLDSELFGHEKGAFTGAVSRREGRFMSAAGGTLLLDEIGSCPPSVQVKLLRFLQTRRFERVGGNETLTVDVRLIAATNKDLEAEVEKGRFREDLYYRLNVVPIGLPPLRHRRSDVPALAEAFLARYAREHQKRIEGFAREALERLVLHSWPGNVRELEHAVEHAAVMARGPRVVPDELPDSMLRPAADPLDVTIPGSTLAEIERAAILQSVMAVGGKVTEAATMLGISRSKIYSRLREYGERLVSGNGQALNGFSGPGIAAEGAEE